MKNKLRNKKGITLIALVITIIVLLILAGVSITMISSQDGILGKATNAKESQRDATELERVKLAVQSALVDGEGTIDLTKATDSTKAVGLEKALQEEFKNDGKQPTYEEGKVTLTNGDIYNVTTSGNVEKAITFKKNGELAIGSEVTASNGESFYVIGFSEDNTKVNLLAKYNLKADGSSQDTTGETNPCAFCSETAWSGANVVSGDNLNNKTTISSETTSAVGKVEAYGSKLGAEKGRLMVKEEADTLKTTANTDILYGNKDGKKLNYWLGSASDSSKVWLMYGECSDLSNDDFNIVVIFGVRPVLEVLTSSIK